jgi:hypothetical protein
LVHIFDILAAVVFAASGSLVAARKGMDVVGFMWLSVITGVGGGTVRDVILDVPVFWVQQPVHVVACLATAVVMHFIAPLVQSRVRTLDWFDAFGLALVTIAGTAKALDVGAPAIVAIAMGVVRARSAASSAIWWATCRRSFSGTRSTSRPPSPVPARSSRSKRRACRVSPPWRRALRLHSWYAAAIAYGWSLPVFRGSAWSDHREHEEHEESKRSRRKN